ELIGSGARPHLPRHSWERRTTAVQVDGAWSRFYGVQEWNIAGVARARPVRWVVVRARGVSARRGRDAVARRCAVRRRHWMGLDVTEARALASPTTRIERQRRR